MYKTKRCENEKAYYSTRLEVSNRDVFPILEHLGKSTWVKDIRTITTEHTTDIFFLAEQTTIDSINAWLFTCAKDNDYWNRI